MGLKFSKEKQIGKKKKPKKVAIHIPEKANQTYADDYLVTLGIQNFRIPDQLWSRLGNDTVAKAMLANGTRKTNGGRGLADNTNFIEVCWKFSLCLHLEQKSSTGVLRGEQKNKARVLPYRIARSPEDTTAIVQDFVRCARKLQKFLEDNPDFFKTGD